MNKTKVDLRDSNSLILDIIDRVKKYQENGVAQLEDNSEVDVNKEIIVIVGDSKYPQRTKVPYPINAKAFGVYNNYGFSEVAFLCDRKTIELFSIIGIFFDSIDKAAFLINMLIANNLIDAFAKYLYYEKKCFACKCKWFKQGY